ncbi:hypothetical protein HG531_008649 [Fusarium graminearum]|nr:hypothetical protein HG531_008649 [Fusarium graminearum]
MTQSSPSANKTHEESSEEHKKAGIDTLAAAEELPALIAKEILREKLNQGSKGKQASRDSIHDAYNDEPSLGVGAVETKELTMKDNGNEKNDKLIADRNTKRHANKNTVEENAKLEQYALEKLLALLLLWGQDRHLYSLEARLLEVLSSGLHIVVIFTSFFFEILHAYVPAVQSGKVLTNA